MIAVLHISLITKTGSWEHFVFVYDKVVRLFSIFKFWLSCYKAKIVFYILVIICYVRDVIILKKSLNSWVSNLKIKLCEIGLGDFWLNQDNICVNLHFLVIKQRIVDIFVQSNFELINCSSKCKVYMQ